LQSWRSVRFGAVARLRLTRKSRSKPTWARITLELYPDKAPKTVENFLQYVNDGHYKGTIFHRVIPGFMVQGGGFNVDFMQKKTRPPVPNEANNGSRTNWVRWQWRAPPTRTRLPDSFSSTTKATSF
jgi:cyclophilin family peptidyl-prolyl cis-trans isomerase